MDSATNITINIVEPGSDVPVPDTGLFTHGIGGTEASIIATVGIVIIIAIAAIILYLRKKKINLKPSKHTSIILSILAIITSIATFTGLTLNSIYSHTNAKEGDLTVAAEDTNLTIEVGNQPVFAVLPVQVTVEEATQAGYTLTAYTDNTDLVSTTNPNNKIPMVTVEGDELTTLQDNTWGLALDNEPTAKDNKVYKALSTDQTNPTLITDKDYEETPANDTTTIYYGFYITPDMPVGTYVGDGEVVYDAIPNLATVTFDANGLYYNNDESLTTNTLGYKPNVAEAPIELVTGEYLTPAPLNPDSSSSSIHYTFLGWSKTEGATTPDYEDEEDILANLTLTKNESLTLYAVWHYNTVLSFNGNTSDGGEPIADITIPAGTTITLPPNTFTKEDYIFASWNTKADGTGDTYPDQGTYIAPVSESQNITLYAQWTDCAPNSICYNDNGANSPTTMGPQSASSNTDVELWASNYKYDTNNDGHNDYGFAGWSEDKDAAAKLVDNDSTNNPVVYGPNQTITTGDLSTAGMKLYAVWIAPEQNTSFQAFTCPTNEDMPIGTIIALKDNRDNEVYTVAKLADGNCWMTENLRLDNNATINAANTNNPISTFTALSPSSDSWCKQNTDACYNKSLLNTNNIANTVSPMTRTNANIYSYGNYYNWYSATAGNGVRGTTSTVAGDLCPAGWHLPYGGNGTGAKGGNTRGGFYYLDQQMGAATGVAGSNNWRSFPNNFVYSGSWFGSSADDRGSSGYYWSSTPFSAYTDSAYILSFSSGGVGPGMSSYNKDSGESVRCVAPVGTTITFDGNSNTSGEMSKQRIAQNTTAPLDSNKFTKGDDIFVSWNTERDGSGTSYADGQGYTAGEGNNNVTLYAQWKVPLTFTAGDHIDTLLVADSTQNWKPFYVTPTSTDKSIVFTAPAKGTKYIITVVPEPGYVLSSDSTNSSYVEDFSTGTLASNTLLTTTYVAGAEGDNITISAAQAGSDSTHPSYTSMQDLTATQCPAYTDSAQGINVTDIRNNKSYAVAKISNYCYMLSNIRVDGNTALTPATSHVSSDYTLPADTGSGGWTDDYCQPRMASINGEYYYNWPAATARTNSTSGTRSCSNDTSNSVGDICPAGWILPTYQDISPDNLWDSFANPGMLSTTGHFYSGSQYNVGNSGLWWSNTRFSNNFAYYLYFGGTSARRDFYTKSVGVSVRCMRSS